MSNEAFNIDCMDYMRSLPDKAFDLAVVDPPYGIDITGRHTHTQRGSSAVPDDHLEERMVTMKAPSKSALTSLNFTMRSTTAPRRAQNILGSWRVLQNGVLFGVGTSSLSILARQAA